MKLLVCSDSHGSRRRLCEILEKECPDAFYFLGDGLRDAEYAAGRYPQMAFLAVTGNCDYRSDGGPDDWLTEVEGVRIYLCHGHLFGVKSGLSRLERRGRDLGAQLVLFGHTHRPYLQGADGVMLLNPGSVGEGLRSSYAVVSFTGGGKFTCQLLSL